MILSDAVGCHPEALREGRNGYLCEANSVESLAGALSRMAEVEDSHLVQMGLESRTVARERFDSRQETERFVDFLEMI
jgi:glycosyltransferase involved in cell wall biosynthesis